MNQLSIGHIRRVVNFISAIALIGLGDGLLYRHLLYGDKLSIVLMLVSFALIGWGIILFPTPSVGERAGGLTR